MKKCTCLMMIGALLILSSVQAALPVNSGLVMHLDAESVTGVADGTPIGTWADQSGSGNDAIQAAGGLQPVYVTNSAVSNAPAIRFDGSDDFLDLNETMINVGSFTVFAVGRFDSTQDSGNHYMIGAQVNGDDRLRINWDQAPNPDVFGWRVGNSANLPGWSPPADADAHVFVATSEVSGYMDGTFLGSSANTSTLAPTGLNLGSHPGGTRDQFFKGDIAEIIVYNRLLTETEMEQVGVYLSNKYPAIDTAYRNLPHDPSPADAAGGVLTEQVLTWKAGLDPADLTNVNPAIKKHYVWINDGTADPNLMLAATIDITNYNDVAADAVYDPTPDLANDGTYTWMVEEGLDNGLGGTYPAGDPNNLAGPLWSFVTVSTVPEITVEPVSVKLDAGQTAEFQVEFTSAVAASVTWYKDGAPLTAGGDISIVSDADSSTLSIASVDAGDTAGYYAIVSNAEGDSDPTDTAYLAIRQRLAWYPFEQNLDDAAGINDAADIGGIHYTGGIITAGGQAFAADPNSSTYGLLTTEAFPKAGFGNGLEAFTYSCWVKLGVGEGGPVFANFNLDANTGIRLSVNGVENNVSVYLRQDGGSALEAGTSALPADSEWHHVAAAYNGSQLKLYIDGTWRANSATATLTDFAEWENPLVLLAKNNRGTVIESFTGDIDDLQIYNYALSSEQIAQQYLSVEGGWVCDEEQPALPFDFDDNCRVDLGDFAIFAAEWLDSNRIYAQ